MIKIMAVKFQVLIMLALLTALSVFVLVNFFNYMNSWKASDRLNDEGRTFTQVLAAAVFNDIKARDFRALEKNVKNAVQNLRYVSRVIVYDKEDNTLFNWKTDGSLN